MRRPSQERPDEIAYADVAMAILGPVMFLMVVFAVRTGDLLANRGCVEFEDASPEIAEHASQLITWLTDSADDTASIEARIRASCTLPTSEAPPEDASPDQTPVAVQALVGLCSHTRSSVLATAGKTEQEIERVATALADARARAAACLAEDDDDTDETGIVDCQRPQGAERATLLRELTTWAQEIAGESERLEQAVDEACPDLEAADRPLLSHVPAPVAMVCPDERESLLQEAGLTVAELQERTDRWETALTRAVLCAGPIGPPEPGPCPDLPAMEVSRRAAELRLWNQALEQRIAALDGIIERYREADSTICGGVERSAEAASLLDGLAGLEPAALADLCPDQRRQVATRAGIDLNALNARSTVYVATAGELQDCLPPTTEFVTARQTVVHFGECQVTFEFGDGTRNEDEYFADMAKYVMDTLMADRQLNRIDVIGRSDGTPPLTPCRGMLRPGILAALRGPASFPIQRRLPVDPYDERFNALLSGYRAMVFAQRLQQALEDLEVADMEVAEELAQRDIRLYAIGAGTDRPMFDDPGQSREDPAERRIDIRFAYDPNADPGSD